MSYELRKRRWVACAALVLPLAAVVAYAVYGPSVPDPPVQTGIVTVMSYNLHAGTKPDQRTVTMIRDSNADVVCLQEVRPDAFKFLRRKLRDQYPAGLYRNHHDGYGGLAFLGKYRLHDRQWISPTDPAWFPAWIADAETPAGRVQIMNVHLRPRIAGGGFGGKVLGHFAAGAMHASEIEALYASIVKDLPTVILGDFNEFDGDPALEFLADRGYDNALARFGLSPTWNGKVFGVTIRSCVDHITYSPDFDCVSARVIGGGNSDHQPVVATLKRRPTTTSAPKDFNAATNNVVSAPSFYSDRETPASRRSPG